MKKYIFIFFVVFSACSVLRKPNTKLSINQNTGKVAEIKSDTPSSIIQNNNYVPLLKYKSDTLGYIQHNFIDNKQKYVGKDLNTLLNDLEIPIKSFMPHITPLNNETIPSIYLQFQSFKEASIRKDTPNKPVNIIIDWSHPVPLDSVLRLAFKNNKAWTVEERNFFGKRIIGNILRTQWEK